MFGLIEIAPDEFYIIALYWAYSRIARIGFF